jgi:lipopolysaccharide/colanic/teichoic acid biosynthesis glycosyltransferase
MFHVNHGASFNRIMETTNAAPQQAVFARVPKAAPRLDAERRPKADGPNPPVQPKRRSEVASRMLNVLVASVALILVSPIILVAAILIKLTSRGPVFYRQVRVGMDARRSRGANADRDCRRSRDLGGRVFSIYKMRTMYVDAEQRSGAVWATKSDPRVTPVGRVLRKFRIDELPQLLNVIQNTMSIVGPRPERPSIFAKLSQDIADYQIRQRAKPGITGWAQINHSYDTTIDDVRTKVRYDLEYLERQGVAEDVRIMMRTLPVMLLRKGGW